MSTTPRHNLSIMAETQTSAFVLFNELLTRFDSFGSFLPVESRSDSDPPGSPNMSDAYIVQSTATGAWTGQEGFVALWDGGAWQFFEPWVGLMIFNRETERVEYYDGALWRSVNSEIQRGLAVDAGSVLDPGELGRLVLPAGLGSLTEVTVIADAPDTLGIDIKKAGTLATMGSASSIVGSSAPDLSASDHVHVTDMTGWDTPTAKNNVLIVEITGTPAAATSLSVVLTFGG